VCLDVNSSADGVLRKREKNEFPALQFFSLASLLQENGQKREHPALDLMLPRLFPNLFSAAFFSTFINCFSGKVPAILDFLWTVSKQV
jgi:hypothetical protein